MGATTQLGDELVLATNACILGKRSEEFCLGAWGARSLTGAACLIIVAYHCGLCIDGLRTRRLDHYSHGRAAGSHHISVSIPSGQPLCLFARTNPPLSPTSEGFRLQSHAMEASQRIALLSHHNQFLPRCVTPNLDSPLLRTRRPWSRRGRRAVPGPQPSPAKVVGRCKAFHICVPRSSGLGLVTLLPYPRCFSPRLSPAACT